MNRKFVSLTLLSIGVTCIWSVGCQQRDIPTLGKVSGVVTLDGNPLPGASIVFSPEEGRASSATTDENGQYLLRYTMDLNGALIGTHTVIITTAQEAYSDESGQGKNVKAKTELLPAKYHTNTELKADVEQGENKIDFPLTSS
ncbi:transthyretin-like family protein [Calycomorphotria hydatis]|uniref:Carboxypeptidase regulatory-like domain-containing protein n=1 Tax=Calycomorphotria hydatis TaxID=2528027 RepID=A0A517T5B2_9PLAN|nr:carboxypeptidase-like regulatory domain-containing protein [Calycomorphotria hydatis]QDT63531.1 hypothetical protein V22_07530 [Calycomorphotria hydatis]